MATSSNPLANLETLAEFDIPLQTGPSYSPSSLPVIALAQVITDTPGPGGARVKSTLPLAASLLGEFAKVLTRLSFEQVQQIQQDLKIDPPNNLQSTIETSIMYLTYLEGRDEKLLQTLSGIMKLTK